MIILFLVINLVIINSERVGINVICIFVLIFFFVKGMIILWNVVNVFVFKLLEVCKILLGIVFMLLNIGKIINGI